MDPAPRRRPEHLDLRGQGLTAVPDWVWSLRGLQTLNLSENRITSVSDELAQLGTLRMLDLGHNELTALPEGLGELVGLSDYLYLSNNRLTNFPAFLGRLSRLKYLNVTDNELSELPDAIGDMSNRTKRSSSLFAVSSTPSQLAVPVDIGNVRLAVLTAQWTQPDFFAERDLLFMRAVSRWLANAAQHAEAVEVERSATDLTRRLSPD
jgi:hypothetical protein